MGPVADAGAEIRSRPADIPLLVQEQLDLLDERTAARATDAELGELIAELLQLRAW